MCVCVLVVRERGVKGGVKVWCCSVTRENLPQEFSFE